MPPEHVHHRETDIAAARIYIPGWVKGAVGIVVSIIIATIATLSWMDNRYAKLDEAATKTDIAGISQTLNLMHEDLKDIKRAMYNHKRDDN